MSFPIKFKTILRFASGGEVVLNLAHGISTFFKTRYDSKG